MNKVLAIVACLVALLTACGQPANDKNFKGEWTITSMSSPDQASLMAKDTLTTKEAMLLALLVDSIKPSLILTEQDIILKGHTNDSDAMAYSLAGSSGNNYRLQTALGPGALALSAHDKATLDIAGITFQLERKRQDKTQ